MARLGFGRFVLDTDRGCVTASGTPLVLTPKVFDTLRLLVDAGGAVVERETFLAALWPDTVVEERNLTVNISTLRRALKGSGAIDYIETVPKVGYRLTVPVSRIDHETQTLPRSEPPRVIAVPAPALTDEGYVSKRAWHWSVRAAFLTGVVVMLVSIGALSIPADSPVAVGASRTAVRVAVLPFVEAGVAADGAGVGVALADGVIARLDGLSPLTVLPTSAVLSLASSGDSVAVGKSLGVERVVEGVFQKVGSSAIVTSRIVDVATGAAVWSERFEHPYSDLFELQDALSAAVADSFMVRMSIERTYTRYPRRPSNPDAYRAYLEARMNFRRLAVNGMTDAVIAAARRSIALDAEFAPAWTALARAYRVKAHERPLAERLELASQARSAVEKALSLDPELPEAHTVLGMLNYNFAYDWAGAEADFRRAVQLDPRSEDSLSWLANFLRVQGRFDESILRFEQARQVNPFSATFVQLLGEAYWFAGRIDESLGMLDQASRINPSSSTPLWRRAWVYDTTARPSDALDARRAAVRLDGVPDLATSFGLEAARGYTAALEAELRWRQQQRDEWEMAHLELLLGRRAAALDLIERCVSEYCANAPSLATEPRFRALRGEPRFRALVDRARLSQVLAAK